MRTCRYALISLFLMGGALSAQGDFEKGLSYYKQKQYDKALPEFEKLVEEFPDYEDGYRILGDCYLKTRKYELAEGAFKNALRLKEDNFASHMGLATALYNRGRYADAAAALLKAERHASSTRDRLRVYETRGAAYFNLRSYSKALNDLEQAQSIQRGGVSNLLQIGMSHYELGNIEKASQALQQVKALEPSNQQAAALLSQISYRKALQAIARKDARSAISILKEFVAQHPTDGEAWFNLGEAHLLSEDLRSAKQAYLKSSEHLGGRAATFDRLGYIYEISKEYRKALESYQTAYSLSKDANSRESVERLKKRIEQQKGPAGG